jgi:signal transduction histidine kinase
VLDASGSVLYSNRKGLSRLDPSEMRRAMVGEEVFSFGHRQPLLLILPIRDSQSRVTSVLVLQRAPHRERLPRFPLAFSLLVAGVAIAIMVIPLSRRFTRPLRELHGLARRWAEGHLEERSTVRGRDEIGELGSVFNSMADSLQKMLQQKKEFLALISHELKSPVARMKIATEILAERHADHPEILKLVHGIQSDLSESEKMIEQLLMISRIEMDLSSPMRERVDVGEMVSKAVQQVQPVAQASGIALECELSSAGATLSGDEAELQRAMANIIENAVKFSPEGSHVKILALSENGRIRVSVLDSGTGIPPEEREKIFEPFYRGKGAAGKSGSGLGLFLARRIVEHHGGSIAANENTTGGTIITVDLPRSS